MSPVPVAPLNGNPDPNGSGYTSPQAELEVHPTSVKRVSPVVVHSPNTVYTSDHITATFANRGADVVKGSDGLLHVTPTETKYEIQTDRQVGKTGLMMVGWGGNNGTTVTATILANRHQLVWHTKSGPQGPNYIGSLVRASTMRLGTDPTTGKDACVPMSDVLPMVHPNDLVLGGWDISGMPLDRAMRRAEVLDYDLQRQVSPLMAAYKPLPSIYYPDFIAANQEERADNLIPGDDKQVHLDAIRADIRSFKAKHGLDSVIVFWTANTERYADIIEGVNDTSANLLNAIAKSHSEVSPSTVFAVAAILEGCPFINGAPQNTFVPGCIQLASEHKSFIAGDDLKTGQTKVKSVLAEFLTNAGIKMLSIASYNHLGNNDGHNLSAERQFKSKEISKRSVVDDMVESNALLFKRPEMEGKVVKTEGEHPDHIVVIKYVPAVGDSKRAIDEYHSELMMGGRNTLNIFNECEDSLLASPLILDLTILAELFTRVHYRRVDDAAGVQEYQPLYPILSLLSYMLKAPLVKPGHDVVNSLGRQRNALEGFFKSCLGLENLGDVLLESRIW